MERAFVTPPTEESWKKATAGELKENIRKILERLNDEAQKTGKGVSVVELKKIDPTFDAALADKINLMLRVRGARCKLVPMCEVADWDAQNIGITAI